MGASAFESAAFSPLYGAFCKNQTVGDADMYFDRDGRCWLAVSACRPYGEKAKRSINMDRESFIVPVKWDDGWPYAAYESGHIDNAYSLSGVVVTRADDDADAVIFPVIDDFNENKSDFSGRLTGSGIRS